jgi:hypothetical protein
MFLKYLNIKIIIYIENPFRNLKERYTIFIILFMTFSIKEENLIIIEILIKMIIVQKENKKI